MDIRAYFESGDDPWEGRYRGDNMEASTYQDRQDASLALVRHFVPRGASILEVGCGPGYLSLELQRSGFHMTCCDLALRMVREIRDRTKNGDVLVADIHAPPFQEAAFDSVILIGVISYVADPTAVLQRIRQLLKPDGVLLISSPNTHLLFNIIGNKLSAPFYRMGATRPVQNAKRKFFSETCTYYKAREFNSLATRSGFILLGKTNIGFGRLRILNKNLFPDRLDIGLSRFVSELSRFHPFRWLGDFAFANIACFRRADLATNHRK